MELAKIENQGKNVVSHQESFSEESSKAESTKQVGNAKVSEKSSSYQSEQAAQVVQKTGTGTVSKVSQSSFSSTKEEVEGDEGLGRVGEDVSSKEAKVNDLIKSFEENQVAKAGTVVRTEVEIACRESQSSSSKALELINKFIDVPEPVTEVVKGEAEVVAAEPEPETATHVDPIDREMSELSKEIEELKKEEERCEKSYVTRQTSTSSLEEAFVRRLEERRYKSVREVLADSLPPLFKVERPESLPPGNLLHLLHSVQIAQELNSVLKQCNKEKESSSADDQPPQDDNAGRDNRPIDLEKLFTPATDSGEVTPSRNRKMYASSSFYSPFHPTVEDQVELARRISSSLCDISNKQSKGQSMYVNRMKRSVKWVHGGEENESRENTYTSTNEESSVVNYSIPRYDPPKNPLKLVMNPHGKVQDLHSLTQQGLIIQPPLSPELCFDLVKDLNTTKGKGAELFAKRRKKSEKWVVDENTVKQTPPLQRQESQTSTEKVLMASSQQREQQMQKMQEVKGRLSQPKVKLVRSPWEAALETGSVEAAFEETGRVFPEPPISWTAKISESSRVEPRRGEVRKYGGCRSDLYLPNIPKGWTSSQFGGSLYGGVKVSTNFPGRSKEDKSGSSRTVLSQLNTNTTRDLTQTFSPLHSTPRPALRKPPAEEGSDGQVATVAGKKREVGDPREREHRVTFSEEATVSDVKKVKYENVSVMEKELESVRNEMRRVEEEGGVRRLEEKASEALRGVVGGGGQKSKPASLVIGAVPLFRGAEEVATKTNLLLHEELQSKMPGKKQRGRSTGVGGEGAARHSDTCLPRPDGTCQEGRSVAPEPDQLRTKEKPLPQVTALQSQPPADPTASFPPQSQHYSKLWDFTSWNNYNTAPRGWKQNLDYYRPVTFTPSYKLPGSAYYTDY